MMENSPIRPSRAEPIIFKSRHENKETKTAPDPSFEGLRKKERPDEPLQELLELGLEIGNLVGLLQEAGQALSHEPPRGLDLVEPAR